MEASKIKQEKARKKEEELAYIRKQLEENFHPNMFHTQQDRDIMEKGKFRAVIWPTMSGNPFIFVGLFMIAGCFVYGMRYGGANDTMISITMLNNRTRFQALTLLSVIGGFRVSKQRKSIEGMKKEIEEIRADMIE